MEEVLSRKEIPGGRFLLPDKTEILARENSTQRAGYFIVTAGSPRELNRIIRDSYKRLSIRDEEGREMIQYDERMLFPDE
jgi:hypothetical protein